MDNYNNNYYRQPQTPPPYRPEQAAVQTQTNAVMRKVHVRMFIGLLITAFCSLGIASSPTLCMALLGNRIVYFGIWIGMLIMAFVIPARMNRMSSGAVLGLFCLFSALMACSWRRSSSYTTSAPSATSSSSPPAPSAPCRSTASSPRPT